MAKRRRTVTRSHSGSSTDYRPGFSRGSSGPNGRRLAPPSERNNNRTWWILGGAAIALVLAVLVYIYGFTGNGTGASSAPTGQVAVPLGSVGPTLIPGAVHAPTVTPLTSPPAQPAGDGTSALIQTTMGPIVFDIYNQSAPVASENFIDLANANYFNGLDFHRIVPGFVIQGGDPNGDGSGGPGYKIPDEPVVGDYTRGIVAMARTSAANSAGSQFFIVLDDSVASTLPKSGGYVIFGKVTSGMDVVDAIAATPNSGPPNNSALDPVIMNTVTIQPPGSV
jgi:cyclophilin family peptidyl-prolyl cis-trans isomerase